MVQPDGLCTRVVYGNPYPLPPEKLVLDHEEGGSYKAKYRFSDGLIADVALDFRYMPSRDPVGPEAKYIGIVPLPISSSDMIQEAISRFTVRPIGKHLGDLDSFAFTDPRPNLYLSSNQTLVSLGALIPEIGKNTSLLFSAAGAGLRGALDSGVIRRNTSVEVSRGLAERHFWLLGDGWQDAVPRHAGESSQDGAPRSRR